jgi:LysR family glycine cleavage system transcriptional activator
VAHETGSEYRHPHIFSPPSARPTVAGARRRRKRCFLALSHEKTLPHDGVMGPRLPSLTGLEAFEAIARHGGLAGAAAELRVTRAALGHRVRRLEAQLGIALFARGPGGLTLTRAGLAALTDVRAAFARLRVATEALPTSRQRVLRLSTTPTLAAKWLIPRLPSFHAAHPGIEVRMATTMRRVDFAREGVDLAIRYGSGVWPGLLAERLPVRDAVFPVCAPALPRAAPAVDLGAHTLLYVDYERNDWHAWLTAAGVAPPMRRALLRRGQSFDIAYLALEAAIQCQGFALGYAPFVEADLAAGRLIAPFDIAVPCTAGPDAWIVCPEATARSVEISVLRTWLLDETVASRSPAPGGVTLP